MGLDAALVLGVTLELVRVPAGEFLMSSDPARGKNGASVEQPQHRVYASEFHIGKYPITQVRTPKLVYT